jgi:hypothetical protein
VGDVTAKFSSCYREAARNIVVAEHDITGHSTGMWLFELWEELTGACLRGSNYLLIDNRGLQNKIVNIKLPAEKRLRGDMAGLRQGLRRGEYKMKWVPDGSMMADPLTNATCTSHHLRDSNSRRTYSCRCSTATPSSRTSPQGQSNGRMCQGSAVIG